jgi:hypothetical protein
MARRAGTYEATTATAHAIRRISGIDCPIETSDLVQQARQDVRQRQRSHQADDSSDERHAQSVSDNESENI